MSELAKYLSGNQLQISDEEMAKHLSQTADEATTGSGAGVTYLNFSGKTGAYSLGRDKEDIDPEDVFILEPQTCFTGWQCWKASKPVAKHKWSVYAPQNAVAERDLEDHGPYKEKLGEGWKRMLGFGVIDAVEGTQIEFSTDSVSGRNAVSGLLDEIAQRMRAGEAGIPLVRFDKEQFTAQEQRNWKPKFVVEAWVSRDQVMAYMSEEVEYDMDDLIAGKRLTDAQKKKVKTAA